MKSNLIILKLLSFIIPVSLYFVKEPTNYFFTLLLIQGFASIYYGLHLIQRGQIEGTGNTFLSDFFAQNDKASKSVNLKRFGVLIILAGLIQFLVYYLASNSIK